MTASEWDEFPPAVPVWLKVRTVIGIWSTGAACGVALCIVIVTTTGGTP